MKQVILVNGWLDMPLGKVAAQVSHASIAPISKIINNGFAEGYGHNSVQSKVEIVVPKEVKEWIEGSFTKVVLVVRTEEEWTNVKKKLDKNDVEYFEIVDKGLTVFDGVPTHTCTGFNPMKQDDISKYFGHLPLLK